MFIRLLIGGLPSGERSWSEAARARRFSMDRFRSAVRARAGGPPSCPLPHARGLQSAERTRVGVSHHQSGEGLSVLSRSAKGRSCTGRDLVGPCYFRRLACSPGRIHRCSSISHSDGGNSTRSGVNRRHGLTNRAARAGAAGQSRETHPLFRHSPRYQVALGNAPVRRSFASSAPLPQSTFEPTTISLPLCLSPSPRPGFLLSC